MKKPIILVISSPSGGGKTTIARGLKKFGFEHITTATTRPKRPNEREGIDYYFVSRETFIKWIDEGKLFEWAEIYGNYYGVPKENLYKSLRKGKNVVLTLDVNGKRALERVFKEDEDYRFISIFLMPPSVEELERRLKKRGETGERLKLRLSRAKEEMNFAKEYDYTLINDRVDRVIKFILCKVI